MMTHIGLSERFVTNEAVLRCGDCLCSDVMENSEEPSPSRFTQAPRDAAQQLRARNSPTATAFTITHNKQRLGITILLQTVAAGFGRRSTFETPGSIRGNHGNLRLRSRESGNGGV